MQKKIILLIAWFSTSFITGMENEVLRLGMLLNDTQITVIYGSLHQAINKVDLIIFNKTQSSDSFIDTTTNKTKIMNRSNHCPNTQSKYYCSQYTPNAVKDTKSTEVQTTNTIGSHYKSLLYRGQLELSSKKRKTIALNALSRKSGFSEDCTIAGTATGIFDFITDFPKAYHHITLFVDQKNEVELYINLFMEVLKKPERKSVPKTDFMVY